MSEEWKYRGGQAGGLREEYAARWAYRSVPSNQMLDSWYEFPNYGMLNENFEPVVLLVEPPNNTSISSFSTAPNVTAAIFATTAFEKFKEKYVEFLETSQVGPPDFIGSLTPTGGYLSFSDTHNKYLDFMLKTYYDVLEGDNFRDFGGFVDAFIARYKRDANLWPITRSSFVLSGHCPVYVSGLYIDLNSDQDYNLDASKGTLLESESFSCYLDYANDYGFLVDKNAPWRLVVDLNSAYMREHISSYSGQPFRRVLSKIFRVKPHYDDLNYLQSFLFFIYNRIATNTPIRSYTDRVPNYTRVPDSHYEAEEVDGVTVLGDYVRESPQPAAPESRPGLFILRLFDPNLEDFGVESWLKLLLKIKMLELGMDMDNYPTLETSVLDIHATIGAEFRRNGEDPLRPALGKIGEICSSFIKEKYKKRYAYEEKDPDDYYNWGGK